MSPYTSEYTCIIQIKILLRISACILQLDLQQRLLVRVMQAGLSHHLHPA